MADSVGGTDGESRDEPTAGSGPGFTVLVAVIALLSAAALARQQS
ncbi:unknown [Haloarcula marismortui ATCC 43049]|uniref:PGF-CTERM archaeal protein-sorting signal domain-containing protein n=2 Tax=Haloarcula marismortui TaxID=2238 RepID=Q5UXY2_HALMA|nr:unknown [Haloarcula marismortui ATCC 43049]